MRALGKIFGYYPEDAFEAWRVDSTLDFLGDFTNARYKANNHPDPETKEQVLKDFYEKTLADFFQKIQKRLEDNEAVSTTYFVGDKMTIADFGNAAVAYNYFLNEHNADKEKFQAVLNNYPKVLAYYRGLGELLKDYLTTRRPSPW